jgi:hypothetical protein
MIANFLDRSFNADFKAIESLNNVTFRYWSN